MPLYEYKCEKGHVFEVVQRMVDPAIEVCEVCGKSVQRVFHAPAVHFKGSGFYNTDYGRRNRGTGTDTGEASEGKKDGSGDSGGSGDTGGKEKASSQEKPDVAKGKGKPADAKPAKSTPAKPD